MKKGKIGLAVFSAAVLLAILLMAIHTIPGPAGGNPVVIQAGAETLEVWTEDGETYYAFLPGYADPGNITLLPGNGSDVTLDGQKLPLSCDHSDWDRAYDLVWQEDGAEHHGTLRLLQGGGTATLYLDTQSGSMAYIHEEKGNAEHGSMRLYDEAGVLNYSGNLRSVRGRGNSTWVVHEKKPYSLELSEEADLLGMGAAKKWVLLADALDTSALRNKTVLDFAARAGLPFTPECRWTEVYLNGEYAGLYLLCERVEVDPRRLDLTTDGSLICMDRDIRVEGDTAPYFVTDNGQYLQIQDSADIGALNRLIQSMENAILSEEGTRWQDRIDMESWVKKYLIEEIFGSYDAGFQSQYFYCHDTNENSKIYAGPVWDFDSSLGNPGVWALNSPRGLFAWRPQAMVGYDTPWLHSLYQKPEFREKLREEYSTVFLPLLETLLNDTITEYTEQLSAAFGRNKIRWNVDTPGIQAEAAAITGYLKERMEFLWELWLEEKEFCILRLQENGSGGYYAYYAVEPGTRFEELPQRDGEGFLGWYREDTDTLFDPAEPIQEDICLYPKYAGQTKEPESDGKESLMDRILAVYHYVPGAVLLLMGLILLPLGIRKGRGTKRKEKQGV